MKIAHINSKAAAGGSVRRTSLVRRLLACALIGGAAMSVAHAGPGRGQQQQQQPEYRQEYNRDDQRARQYEERQQRQFDERAQARAEEQQRRQMEQQGNDGRRNSRMTPDERRDLRRQINEAGAELYPNQGRRR